MELTTCEKCGQLRHPMADRGELCCGWEREALKAPRVTPDKLFEPVDVLRGQTGLNV